MPPPFHVNIGKILYSNEANGIKCVYKKNATPIFLYIWVRINIIWAEIGCPLVRFAYRNMAERLAVLEIFAKPF
jgi:hypothetical protein